jgi:hypothetical protein
MPTRFAVRSLGREDARGVPTRSVPDGGGVTSYAVAIARCWCSSSRGSRPCCTRSTRSTATSEPAGPSGPSRYPYEWGSPSQPPATKSPLFAMQSHSRSRHGKALAPPGLAWETVANLRFPGSGHARPGVAPPRSGSVDGITTRRPRARPTARAVKTLPAGPLGWWWAGRHVAPSRWWAAARTRAACHALRAGRDVVRRRDRQHLDVEARATPATSPKPPGRAPRALGAGAARRGLSALHEVDKIDDVKHRRARAPPVDTPPDEEPPARNRHKKSTVCHARPLKVQAWQSPGPPLAGPWTPPGLAWETVANLRFPGSGHARPGVAPPRSGPPGPCSSELPPSAIDCAMPWKHARTPRTSRRPRRFPTSRARSIPVGGWRGTFVSVSENGGGDGRFSCSITNLWRHERRST